MRIYTDGCCLTNGNRSGGPGGWAFVVVENGIANEPQSGGYYWTNSSRMEIEAVIRAIASVELGVIGVSVLTDCMTVTHVLDSYRGDTDRFERGAHATAKSPDHELWLNLVTAASHPSVRVDLIRPKPGTEHWEHHIVAHKAAKNAAGRINAMLNNTGRKTKKKKPPVLGWDLHDTHRLLPHLRLRGVRP